MPPKLTTPVVTVDPAKIHEVDTRSAESLHGMWMVFSRCADYMEEGRRLENLSWRLWNRQTFCVAPPQLYRPRINILRREPKNLPDLSSSVDSAASDAEGIESQIKSPPRSMELKPEIVCEDSILSISRGREKHITSIGLEKMVYNIKEKKSLEPLTSSTSSTQQLPVVDITPRASSPMVLSQSKSQQPEFQSELNSQPTQIPELRIPSQYQQLQEPLDNQSLDSCSTVALEGNDSEVATPAPSDTSVSSAGSVQQPSSVVRGFSPNKVSSSFRSHAQLSPSPSIVKTYVPATSSPLKKKGKAGMFTLGGSSGDEDSSFEDRRAVKPNRSSLTDGLNKSIKHKETVKISSIREINHSSNEDAIETDDEDDDEISESAIEDEGDSSDWEDSITESGRSSVNETEMFQRVDSRPDLVSRRSLLTMMMHQPQRNSKSHPFIPRSSRLTSSNLESSSTEGESGLTLKTSETQSRPIAAKPIPIHSAAYSPRTARRNMLATELTESLRRHLLWERQPKHAPLTQFKRRHTSHDVANLQAFPEPNFDMEQQKQRQGSMQPPVMMTAAQNTKEGQNNSWNHYFEGDHWEYHTKGW
ncbi:hypothetical protein FQN57_004023 [Myotisia sp. PD_48]|nr:hypothetical protein FQN57_004023 [Myotisia sp. PD_48]